jgi:hypothetical protein
MNCLCSTHEGDKCLENFVASNSICHLRDAVLNGSIFIYGLFNDAV